MPVDVATTVDTISAASHSPFACVADHVIELSERVDFNMHDSYYEHATENHFWIQWRFETLKRLTRHFDLGSKLFEVGCGNGVVQKQFESYLEQPVSGCDLNYHAMASSPAGRGQRYLYNVLDQREEWKHEFETVLLLDTLEHIEEPTSFLLAIAAHLRDGGLLVINVPAMPWLFSRYDTVQGHVRRYTLGRLRDELNSAGFEIVTHDYWGANVVPIAAIRKLAVNFTPDEMVLTCGFQPPGPFSEFVLRALMRMELSGLRLPGIGTSLAAIARKTC